MKIELDSNGWTVIVHDFDLKRATQHDIDLIGCWLATNTLVVIRNQDMSLDDEIRIVKMFGNYERFASVTASTSDARVKQEKDVVERYFVPDSDGIIIRVTGEKNHKGETGLFGEVTELDWHANKPGLRDRKPLVWLRGVRGTQGSRTSWTNHILAYTNLPDNLKKVTKNLHNDYNYKPESEYDDALILFGLSEEPIADEDYFPPLVHTNLIGKTSLNFSWNQLCKFKELTLEKSRTIIEQLKMCITSNTDHFYHHDWQDGDIIIAEQYTGVHKRHACDTLDKRVLHRATFDFAKIDFNKLAESQQYLG